MINCNKDCKILKYVDELPCPIERFTTTKLKSEWWFEKDGEKLYPLCENNTFKKSNKQVVML